MKRNLPKRWASMVVCASLAGPAWCEAVEPPQVQEAQQAYDKGDYTLAVKLYEQAIEAQPLLRDDAAVVDALQRAEARVYYATGSTLHAEGEYAAAADQFMDAIAKDSEYKLAYAALADAQRAGIRKHLLAAITSADLADLLAAKQSLEKTLVMGGKGNEQVMTALKSIVAPDEVFDQETRDALTEAQRLANDRQWKLAEDQLRSVVEKAPLMLPARAELTRVQRAKKMSTDLTDEGAVLITQKRLTPALEKLASATTVWPYNKRAAELLENIETKVKRANALAVESEKLAEDGQWNDALSKADEALDIDPSHPDARTRRSIARRGLVKQQMAEAGEAIDERQYAEARGLIEQAQALYPNNRWSRKQLGRYQYQLGNDAVAGDQPGHAMLRFVLADRLGADVHSLRALEKKLLTEADASYRITISPHTPEFGVSADQLASAFTTPGVGVGDEDDIVPNAALDADNQPAAPRYRVSVKINETDIELRRTGPTLPSYEVVPTGLGVHTSLGIGESWEKYGTLDCSVAIYDQTTGGFIKGWAMQRWVRHGERKQSLINTAWSNRYWTLPSDESIAQELAADMADQLERAIDDAVHLARALDLRRSAKTLAKKDPDQALELQVSAVVLAGQVRRRQSLIELNQMARELDERQPVPATK